MTKIKYLFLRLFKQKNKKELLHDKEHFVLMDRIIELDEKILELDAKIQLIDYELKELQDENIETINSIYEVSNSIESRIDILVGELKRTKEKM